MQFDAERTEYSDKTCRLVARMKILCEELEATLNDEQNLLFKKYNEAYGKFMLEICDGAYARGFAAALVSSDRIEEEDEEE